MLIMVGWIYFILLFFNCLNQQIYQPQNNNQQKSQTLVPSNQNQQSQLKQKCDCLHNGQCYNPTQSQTQSNSTSKSYCKCQRFYIGQICQTPAIQIYADKYLSEKLNNLQYKYFFYEPNQESMQKFTIELCFQQIKTLKEQENSQVLHTLTFSITIQREDGSFQTNQNILKPQTLNFTPNQCKVIYVDYTVLLVTKIKKVQKIIIGMKLQKPLNPNYQEQSKSIISTQKDLLSSVFYTVGSKKHKKTNKNQQLNKQLVTSINQISSKQLSKFTTNSLSSIQKIVFINFSTTTFTNDYFVFNILFSFTTMMAFCIVSAMIFIIRSRILGIEITRSLAIRSRLANDISHLDFYICQEKFVKKQKIQGQASPNSSQSQCAICLVKFETQDIIRRTHCTHSFHKRCIDAWCKSNLTCPMCRRSLTKKNLQKFFMTSQIQLKNSPQSDQ